MTWERRKIVSKYFLIILHQTLFFLLKSQTVSLFLIKIMMKYLNMQKFIPAKISYQGKVSVGVILVLQNFLLVKFLPLKYCVEKLLNLIDLEIKDYQLLIIFFSLSAYQLSSSSSTNYGYRVCPHLW